MNANLSAQIVNGEAFLQGTYAEVGIGSCGSFGTSNPSPTGYHSRVSSFVGNQSLGFVADIGKDGWSTGFPDFVGDYFLPGSPEEGWGLTIDGVNYNNNQMCNVYDIPGSIISYNATTSQVEATWQGNIGGLNITAKTYIPNNSLYFVTTVTVTNTSASTINNVYYMRNVDPDHGVFTPGGGDDFSTINSIVYQNPNPCNNALVTATTQLGSYYLGLGSIFDDVAFSIAFKLGNLAPNDSTTFSYTYVLSESDLNNALAATNIGVNINSVSYTTGSNVNTCQNTSIPINLTNTGTFNSWSWSPSTGLDTTTGTSVNATITSPTTYTAVGTGPCGSVSITVTLNPVVAQPIGDAALIVGPSVLTLGQTGVNYSIPAVSGATKYTWVLPSGSIVTSGLNTNSITFDAPNTSWCGNINVTPSNDCNSGGSADLPVCLGNQLITGSVISPFCAGQSLTVPYTATGVYSASNIFSVQLSDELGNFTIPYTTIGSITSSLLSGDIPTTIPSSTLAGTNYRIRVVSNLPVLNGIDNGSDLIINAPSAPMSVSQTFCNGATINDLVATGSDIQWYDVITGGAALNNTMALDNGTYYATQTINGCESNTRTSVVVTINPNLTPTVSISSSATTICVGDSITFTATPTNIGGGTINYDFKVNGTSVQSGSSNQFTTTTLADGSSVICDLTITGGTCLTVPFAISNPIIINVNPPISITSTSNNISVGNDLGVCQAMVTYPAATATGIPTPTITYSQDSGTIFPVGTTTVTVTATNTCGSVTSSFTVTVNDTEAPVITTPSDISVNNDLNTCGAVVTYTAPTVLDNCVTSTSGNQTFNYTGSIQTWTVPAGVTAININGKGAQGGNTGGLGAQIRGDFAVTPGDVLNILVGQMGTLSVNDNGGGGGGTFIWKQDGNVLFIAAGGGGGRAGNSNGSFGGDGSADTTPNDSVNGSGNGTSGTLGNGGVGGTCDWINCDIIGTGGGGSGWLSNGLAGTGTSNDATGGNSPLNNGAGGSGYNDCQNENVYGGYGGGGGGGGCSGAGGGGGGYNGGGGGNSWNGDTWGSGAGGGSYNIGTNQNNTAGANIGDGSVTISWLGAGSITQTSGLPSGSIFPVGTTINTFEATDASGNVATSSFLVTVTDNELPTIICPVSVTVNSDPGVCFATGVILDTPLTVDNCSVVSVTNDAPSQFPVGDTMVTWTVIDASGNANTCTQTVTVNSTIVPNVTLDALPSGPICAGSTVIFTATASNVSDGIVNYNFMVNGNSIQNGISNTFNSSSLLNDDVVTCEINISNTNCLAATIASSNSILMMVNPQPTQPIIACYETATFNTATCSWDVTGTQPIQPTLACYESATFNTTSCSWDVTGTQPAQPTLACYESATFNTTSCSWDVSGTAPDAPTGDIVQTFSVASLSDATLSSLVVNPNTVIWYASLNEALNGSNPLPNTTILTNGSTYYAVNIVSGCSSTPFAVTVSVTLGIDSYEMNSIYIYPNPTTSILNIQSSIPVDKIVITDMLGKILRIQTTNTTKVDVEQFAEGTYIIETTYGEKKFISKFIKK